MTNQIKVTIDYTETAKKLAGLFQKLDSHQMYTDPFVESAGYTREQVGLLTDEFNKMKTTVGKLIDGTRAALRETDERFAIADRAAAAFYEATAPGTVWAEGSAGVSDSVLGSSGGFTFGNRPASGSSVPSYHESIVDEVKVYKENDVNAHDGSPNKPSAFPATKIEFDVGGVGVEVKTK